MRPLLLLALLLPLRAHADDQVDAFWRWFTTHQAELRTIRTAREPIADALATQLHAIDRNLTFETGEPAPKLRELIISADGVRGAFPSVQRLMVAAPKLPGWKLTGFRPRQPGFIVVMQDGARLDPSKVWFRVVHAAEGKPIDVLFYIEGIRPGDGERMRGPFFLLLDGTLGEYDVETQLGGFELMAAPAQPKAAGLQPLSALAAVVDACKPR